MVVRPLFRSFPQNQFQFMPKPIDAVGPIILSEMLNNFSKYECVDLGIGFSGSIIRHDRLALVASPAVLNILVSSSIDILFIYFPKPGEMFALVYARSCY